MADVKVGSHVTYKEHQDKLTDVPMAANEFVIDISVRATDGTIAAHKLHVHKADVSLKNLIIYNALQGNQDAEYRDGAYHVDILPQDNVSVTANTTLRDMYVRIGVLKKPASTDNSYAEYLRKASNYANDDPDIVWLEWVKATNTWSLMGQKGGRVHGQRRADDHEHIRRSHNSS